MLQHCLLTEMAVFSEMDVFSMSPVCSVQTNETNFLEGDELRKCIYSRTSTISLNEKISISEHDVGVLIRHHCSYRPLKKAALLTIANVLNANMPTSPWRRKTTPRGQILKGKDKRPSGVMSAPIQIDGEKYLCNITVKQNLDGIIFPYALTLKDKSGNIVGDEKTDCTLQVPDSDDKCSTTGNTHLDKVATSPGTSQSSQNRANLQQNTLTSNNNNKENINCNKNMKHNRIRLTESQLHRVIKESVKRVLREGVDSPYGSVSTNQLRSTFDDANVQSQFKNDTIDMLSKLPTDRFLKYYEKRLSIDDPDTVDAIYQEYYKRKQLGEL